MKRWFIARMGDFDPNDPGTQVPAVVRYTRSDGRDIPFLLWSAPGFPFGFGKLATDTLTGLDADPDVYILPNGTMEMSVGSIPAGVRNTMRTRLEAGGFVFTQVKTSWTVRQLLVYLLKQLQPVLNSVEDADVTDN